MAESQLLLSCMPMHSKSYAYTWLYKIMKILLGLYKK